MCELMTIAAALVFTVVYFVDNRSKAAFTAMLMFWGAALMWAVDCVANRMDGEPLFDISREDTVLGAIILAAGLLVYGALAVREHLALRRA
jgi:uncharacterized membrane protein